MGPPQENNFSHISGLGLQMLLAGVGSREVPVQREGQNQLVVHPVQRSKESWVKVTWTPSLSVNRITDRHDWKHYLPTTSFVGRKNLYFWSYLASRGPWWLLHNIYIKPQSIPAPGKCLLRNDHRGPPLNKYDHPRWSIFKKLASHLNHGGTYWDDDILYLWTWITPSLGAEEYLMRKGKKWTWIFPVSTSSSSYAPI